MSYQTNQEKVLAELRATLGNISADEVERFIEMVEAAENVFFVGVGRVLPSTRLFAPAAISPGIEAKETRPSTWMATLASNPQIFSRRFSRLACSEFPFTMRRRYTLTDCTILRVLVI